uniref:Uncharacterized protein MANES_09G151900 n=1 Tax=Rhizophora mucronata TaxID=61149 RepID=A0A2P2KMI0_RHIMU
MHASNVSLFTFTTVSAIPPSLYISYLSILLHSSQQTLQPQKGNLVINNGYLVKRTKKDLRLDGDKFKTGCCCGCL